MSKTRIYLIAIFALWFYLHLAGRNKDEKAPTLDDYDRAQSGHGGTMTANRNQYVNIDFIKLYEKGSF